MCVCVCVREVRVWERSFHIQIGSNMLTHTVLI